MLFCTVTTLMAIITLSQGSANTCHGVEDPLECRALGPMFTSLKIGNPPLTLCTVSAGQLAETIRGELDHGDNMHTITHLEGISEGFFFSLKENRFGMSNTKTSSDRNNMGFALFYSEVFRFKLDMSNDTLLNKNISLNVKDNAFNFEHEWVNTPGQPGAHLLIGFPERKNGTLIMTARNTSNTSDTSEKFEIAIEEYTLGASISEKMKKTSYINVKPSNLCQATCKTCPEEYIHGFTAEIDTQNCTEAQTIATKLCADVKREWKENTIMERDLYSCNYTCGTDVKTAHVHRRAQATTATKKLIITSKLGVNTNQAATGATNLFKQLAPNATWTAVTQSPSTDTSDSGLSAGAIAAIASGGVVVAGAAALYVATAMGFMPFQTPTAYSSLLNYA